jgi:hypothetical protein
MPGDDNHITDDHQAENSSGAASERQDWGRERLWLVCRLAFPSKVQKQLLVSVGTLDKDGRVFLHSPVLWNPSKKDEA